MRVRRANGFDLRQRRLLQCHYEEKEEKTDEVVLRSERYVGRQYRSFTLAHDIDRSRAEAKYADGVLELSLPKSTGGDGKQLKIS